MGRFVGKEGGDIVVVSGLQSFIGHGEREMGFRAVLAERHPHCKLLAVLETREQPEKAGELVHSILRSIRMSPGSTTSLREIPELSKP